MSTRPCRTVPAASSKGLRGLVFLAGVNLAAPMSDTVYSSDSSVAGYALHLTRCPPRETAALAAVRERWRFQSEERRPAALSPPSCTPGWAADWDPPGPLPPGAPPSSAALPPPDAERRCSALVRRPRATVELADRVTPLPESLLRPDRWALVVEGAQHSPAPIRLLEARVALAGLRHHARAARQHGERVLSLGDSFGELLAMEKERAADRALASVACRAAAYQIGCELRWRRRYVESEHNILDAGSRRAIFGIYRPGERRVGPAGRAGCPAPERLPVRPLEDGAAPLARGFPAPGALGGESAPRCEINAPSAGAASPASLADLAARRDAWAAAWPGQHTAVAALGSLGSCLFGALARFGRAVTGPLPPPGLAAIDVGRPSLEAVARWPAAIRRSPCLVLELPPSPRHGAPALSLGPSRRRLGLAPRAAARLVPRRHFVASLELGLAQLLRERPAPEPPPGLDPQPSDVRAALALAPPCTWRAVAASLAARSRPASPGMVLHLSPVTWRLSSGAGAAPSAAPPRCPRPGARPSPALALPRNGKRVASDVVAGLEKRARLLHATLRADRPGFLPRARVTDLTRHRYEDALAEFVAFAGPEANVVTRPAGAYDLLDEKLEQYFELLCRTGKGKSKATYTMAAIVHLGNWHRGQRLARLPRSMCALSGWARLAPDESKEPCPWIIAALISRHLAGSDAPQAAFLARAVIVQFGFMLRPNEVLGLRVDAWFGHKQRSGNYDRCAITVAPSHTTGASLVVGPASKEDWHVGRYCRARRPHHRPCDPPGVPQPAAVGEAQKLRPPLRRPLLQSLQRRLQGCSEGAQVAASFASHVEARRRLRGLLPRPLAFGRYPTAWEVALVLLRAALSEIRKIAELPVQM